jgi:ATP-binding cassette, subfamily B (MDR/TAP), member 1
MSADDKSKDMGAKVLEVEEVEALKTFAGEDPEKKGMRPESKEDKVIASSAASSFVAADGLANVQPGPGEAGLALTKLDSKLVEQKNDKAGKELQQDPFKHLPAHEADILRAQVETPDVKVTYFTLFRYANKFDWMIFAVSAICAIGSGAAMPLMTVS